MFDYLLDKVRDAAFEFDPFKHILLRDFFKPEHFERIVSSDQIRLPAFDTNRALVNGLYEAGYQPIEFPGCITNIDEYVAFADGRKGFNRQNIEGYGRHVIEGYGVTFRITDYSDGFLAELMTFFSGPAWNGALADKFGISNAYTIDAGIQKNLRHYEISPHPDTSRKALTYMVNIYTEDNFGSKEMHTHLCRFRPEYAYVQEFWRGNDVDPVWVPWYWTETVKRTNTNNSISIFEPAHDTLHAVRVTEDHLTHQRNQIYGNLWYPQSRKNGSHPWQALEFKPKQTRIGRFLQNAASRWS